MASRRNTARDLAQIAIFAALIAALGLPGTITVGTTGVPITLQTLGIMLTGGILGARKGFLAVASFLLLATAGLPLLAGGRGGIAIWTGRVRRLPGRIPGRRGGDRAADRTDPAPVPTVAGHRDQLPGRSVGRLPVRGDLAGDPDEFPGRHHRVPSSTCPATC